VSPDADDLVQIAERALFDAEQAYRLDPSEANQRRVMKAWSAVRRARGEDAEPEGGGVWPRSEQRGS
jgi:hypothetical protein